MPDIGTIRPTFTSAGACARAMLDRPIAAAPESTVRRVTKPFDVFFILSSRNSFRFFLRPRFLHTEISPSYAVVRAQRLLVAFERYATGLQDIAMIGRLKRFGHALFDQQNGQLRLFADLNQPVENEIGGGWREPHRRLVQHQKFRRGGKPAADREHLLLSAGQRSCE